ncbi:MAG: hypothetical protein EON86_14180, partial [Brevundimonas sp.]
MTILVSATQRFEPGRTVTITDRVGVLITSTSASFQNAGTINVVATGSYLSGLEYDYAGFFEGSVFTNEATGVLKVNLTGASALGGVAYGFSGPSGWNGDLVNAGLIEVLSVSHALGVATSDYTFTMNNTGTLRVQAVESATGVRAYNGAVISNSGTIDVTGRNAIGIEALRASTITNSGSIIARGVGQDSSSVAISFWNSSTSVNRLTNTGHIEGRYAIVDATNGSPPQDSEQIINNSGSIVGIIDLARGDDDLTNSGTITGEVWLGLGNDFYFGSSGSVSGAVHGGFGNDRLFGGIGADRLYGEDGDDDIQAGAGNDFLQGGRGFNALDGGSGDDTLSYAGLTIGVTLDLATGVATSAGR